MTECFRVGACLLVLFPVVSAAQTAVAPGAAPAEELRYVVYLSRHGVRSPTGKSATYNQYSRAAWPEWTVPPGNLTPHGFHLMELFGSYDRLQLTSEGLLPPTGCSQAENITVYADSDQRTRETGRALAEGLMPGCKLALKALPEGTNDPLFHLLGDPAVPRDAGRAEAAVAGRLGGDPANLARAYASPLQALDHVLATCGTPASSAGQRTALLEIPAKLAPGTGDHLVDLKGPLSTASTLAENLLLEYTEGLDKANVGWGCVGSSEIQLLMTLHTAATDFTQRTPEIASAQASNLLGHIALSIEQAVKGKPAAGALGKPGDLALFLIGHDTNQENVAGLLNLSWIIDGRRDDTPPGGSLIFEVWRKPSTGSFSVRTYFTAQTVDQMRNATPLTLSQPPDRVPVFIPGCSRADSSCDLQEFLHLVSSAGAATPRMLRGGGM